MLAEEPLMDTSKTIEIFQSPWRMVVFLALGLAMTLLSAVLLSVPISSSANAAFVAAVAWIGVAFFGACTVLMLWRWISARGPVIVLTPYEWRDNRISASAVPWTAVRSIGTWSYQGQSLVVVSIDPDVEARIGLTRIASWTRSANAALGADGLCVGPQGLKTNFAELLALFTAYADAATSRR